MSAPIAAMIRNTPQTSKAASQAGMIVARPMMAATTSPITRKATKTRATAEEGAGNAELDPLALDFDLGQGNLVIELPGRQLEDQSSGFSGSAEMRSPPPVPPL